MKILTLSSRNIAVLLAMLALSACGKFGELEPKTGSKGIPVAYGKEKAETPDELLTPSAQSRPGLSVELLRRSERREDDPFDLPPGSQPEVDADNASKTDDKDENTQEPGAPVEPK